MSCTSKKSVPKEEDEDLLRIPVLARQLLDLEGRKKRALSTKTQTKLDLGTLEKDIKETLLVLQIHIQQYAQVHGYETELTKLESRCLEVEVLVEKSMCDSDILQQAVSNNKLLEVKVAELTDDLQDYTLRLEKAREKDERQNQTLDRVRKELEEVRTSVYRTEDRNKELEETISRMDEKLCISREENNNLKCQLQDKEKEIDSFPIAFKEVENKFSGTISALNIKTKRLEGEKYKIEGILAEKQRSILEMKTSIYELERKVEELERQQTDGVHAMNR